MLMFSLISNKVLEYWDGKRNLSYIYSILNAN